MEVFFLLLRSVGFHEIIETYCIANKYANFHPIVAIFRI